MIETFDESKDFTLCLIYELAKSGQVNEPFEREIIQSKLNNFLSPLYARRTIDALVRDEWLLTVKDPTSFSDEIFYELSVDAIERIENQYKIAWSDLSKNRDLVREYLPHDPVIVDEVDYESLIPSSDRLVTLDHNSKNYTEATAALEDAIEAVRGDNEYLDTEDKEQRIAELRSGQKILEGPRVSFAKAKILILDTLEYLSKISSAVTKITDAIEKIMRLLS